MQAIDKHPFGQVLSVIRLTLGRPPWHVSQGEQIAVITTQD